MRTIQIYACGDYSMLYGFQSEIYCKTARLISLFPLPHPARVKARIKGIEILAVKTIRSKPERFAEALIMYHFTGTQEFKRLNNIGIVYKPQQIVVCHTRLLLWYDYKCTTDPETP